MSEDLPRRSPPPRGPGCGKILLILFAFFFLRTNYSTVNRVIQYLTINLRSGDDVARKYLEANPWPNTPEDAVRKCFFAIEARSWDDYRNCFEPSAILDPISPGPPGRFYNMSYVLLERDDDVAVVSVSGEWHPSSIVAMDYKIKKISGTVVVVRASKGVLKDVKLPLVDISLSKKGWFVAYTEASNLPYNFGEQDENGALIVAFSNTNVLTPTTTPVPTLDSEQSLGRANRKSCSIGPLAYGGILIVVILLGSLLLSKMTNKQKQEPRDGDNTSAQGKKGE